MTTMTPLRIFPHLMTLPARPTLTAPLTWRVRGSCMRRGATVMTPGAINLASVVTRGSAESSTIILSVNHDILLAFFAKVLGALPLIILLLINKIIFIKSIFCSCPLGIMTVSLVQVTM